MRFVRDGACHGKTLSFVVPDSSRDTVEFGLPSTGNDDGRAFLGEAPGNRFSDSCIPAGHDSNLALEAIHPGSSFPSSSPATRSSAAGGERRACEQKPGSTFLATVMNPECATIRWSGRTLR